MRPSATSINRGLINTKCKIQLHFVYVYNVVRVLQVGLESQKWGWQLGYE